jgi:hypothetical protein
VAGPAAAEPPEPALQGCWNVAIDTPFYVPTIHARLKLSIREQTLTGSISREGKQAALRGPSAQGRRVRFAVAGSSGEARFSGTLEGSKLRGNVSSSRGTFSWAATRC